MSEAAGEKIDHSSVSQDDIDRASRSIKAMSHPLRLKILCILGDSEFSVQDIVDTVGTSQSNISQHLGILKDKGVLATRKEANKVFKGTDLKIIETIIREARRKILNIHNELESELDALNSNVKVN